MAEPVGPPAPTASAFAGAVLAGGASSRLGRDKALAELAGTTLVERSVDALRSAGASPIVVVGGDVAGLEQLGLTVIADGWPGRGPLGGILTAFAWSPAEVVVVVACDLPLVGDEVIGRLRAALEDEEDGPVDAAIARTDRLEPTCAAWRVARCDGAMLAAFTAGERAVHRALGGLSIREVAVERHRLLNVNTPDDLAVAEAYLNGPTA